MVALSDREIKELVNKGFLISENFVERNMTPNGYDLTIGDIQPGTGDSVIIQGNTRFLISTREFMNMTDSVIGMIWIRSSYARKGILGSFGLVDAGFRGNLTLSFYNSSSDPIEITKGDRIAQIVFIRMGLKADQNYSERSGNYQDSRGISPGK